MQEGSITAFGYLSPGRVFLSLLAAGDRKHRPQAACVSLGFFLFLKPSHPCTVPSGLPGLTPCLEKGQLSLPARSPFLNLLLENMKVSQQFPQLQPQHNERNSDFTPNQDPPWETG